ncbi:MAG: Ig-like domain-containing protein [Gemmatimonas sp.]
MNRIITATLVALFVLSVGACSKDNPTAPAISQISLQPNTVQLLSVGATSPLVATVSAGNTPVTNATVSWVSSAPSVATVTASGLSVTVTAVSEGTATITATTGSNITATALVTVTTPKQLTVTTAGTGSGAVTSAPAGVTCTRAGGASTGTCTGSFAHAATVALTAVSATGSTFTSWSGACTGATTCNVTMDQARAVTATFSVISNTLSLTLAGTGNGTVTSTPAGISCTRTGVTNSGTCSSDYVFATPVTLTPVAAAGSAFTGWTGACTGVAACAVTLDQARAVTATFTFITNTLAVTLDGAGSGNVTSSPAGVSCTRLGGVNSGMCTFGFAPGTAVTLTATGDVAMVFAGWSGASCTGTATCAVTLDQARTTTATFDNPCSVTTYSIGTTANGTVNAAGCPRVGTPSLLFAYTVLTQTIFRAEATSTNATGRVLSIVPPFGATFTTAASTAPVGYAMVAPGSYYTGFAQGTPAGTFTFTTTVNPTLTCESMSTTLGVTLDASMFATPTCAAYTPTGLPATSARTLVTTLPGAKVLHITVTSTAFQPVIELRDGTSGAVVKTTATDAVSGTAELTFTPPFTNGYRIMITSRAAGSTGAYRLVIDP